MKSTKGYGQRREVMARPSETRRPVQEDDVDCTRCGRLGAYRFAGKTLCLDCYSALASCCPEFGADDLWTENATTSVPERDDRLCGQEAPLLPVKT